MALKIALLVHRFPPYLGGCEMYSLKLADGLSRLGHQVTVYTTRHPGRNGQEFPYRIREFRNYNPPGSGYFFWPAFLMPGVLDELRGMDVLHSVDFSMYATFGAMLAAKMCRVPLVVTSFYHPPSAMPHPWLKWTYDKTAGRLILSGCSAIITHSDFELRALEREVGEIVRDRLFRMASGPIIEEVVPQDGFREKYGLRGRFVILYVGRIDANKGTDHLLEAFRSICDDNALSNLVMVIVGEEEAWYRWPKATAEIIKEIGDRIVFTGRLIGPPLAAAYTDSDLLVVPSKYESFGFTIIEALSYGTPVVATKVGIAPEVIVNGHNGYLYDYGDAEALKGRITEAVDTARKMTVNSSASTLGFSWDKSLRDTVEIYTHLMDARKKPTAARSHA